MSTFQLNVNALPFSPSWSPMKKHQELRSDSPTAGASVPTLNANASPFVPVWSPAKSAQYVARSLSPESEVILEEEKPKLSDEEVIKRVMLDLNEHLPDANLLDELRAEVAHSRTARL